MSNSKKVWILVINILFATVPFAELFILGAHVSELVDTRGGDQQPRYRIDLTDHARHDLTAVGEVRVAIDDAATSQDACRGRVLVRT